MSVLPDSNPTLNPNNPNDPKVGPLAQNLNPTGQNNSPSDLQINSSVPRGTDPLALGHGGSNLGGPYPQGQGYPQGQFQGQQGQPGFNQGPGYNQGFATQGRQGQGYGQGQGGPQSYDQGQNPGYGVGGQGRSPAYNRLINPQLRINPQAQINPSGADSSYGFPDQGPQTDPYGHYTDSYGVLFGPLLAHNHVWVDTLESMLEIAKQDLQLLQNKANLALDRGEISQPLTPNTPVHASPSVVYPTGDSSAGGVVTPQAFSGFPGSFGTTGPTTTTTTNMNTNLTPAQAQAQVPVQTHVPGSATTVPVVPGSPIVDPNPTGRGFNR